MLNTASNHSSTVADRCEALCPFNQSTAARNFASLCIAAAILLALPIAAVSETAQYDDSGPKPIASGLASADQSTAQPIQAIYRLAAGDRVAIKVYGRDDLSGEFSVRPDGSVVIPLLGAFRADQRTPFELEREIKAALALNDGKRTFVSVEVTEWRPLHVLGAIDKPGVYPFRPGMTVLHAVAAAGGFYRPFATADLVLQVAREAGELRRAKEQLALALAVEARLEAEIAGDDDIDPPRRIAQLIGATSAEHIIAAETALLHERKARYRQQVESLDEQIGLSAKEVAAVEAQLSSAADRVKFSNAELSEIDAVAKRGLANRMRALSVRTEAAAHETEELAISAALVRARRDHAIARQNRAMMDIEHAIRLREELKAARADVRRQELSVATSSAVLQHAGLATVAPRSAPPIVFSVVRLVAGQPTNLPASENFLLEPGDLVRVDIGVIDSEASVQPATPDSTTTE